MEIINFIAIIVLVTASGALAPGSLFFANSSFDCIYTKLNSGFATNFTTPLLCFFAALVQGVAILADAEPHLRRTHPTYQG